MFTQCAASVVLQEDAYLNVGFFSELSYIFWVLVHFALKAHIAGAWHAECSQAVLCWSM